MYQIKFNYKKIASELRFEIFSYAECKVISDYCLPRKIENFSDVRTNKVSEHIMVKISELSFE